MVINYLGDGSFKIQSGQISLLVNPESNRFKADLTLRTLTPAEFSPTEERTDISFAGEYEAKGVEVRGIPVTAESTEKFIKTVYLIKWEDVKLAVLGHVSRPLASEIIDKLDEPDVLILPVGGGHFLEPEVAAKLAKQFEPAFVIPTFYKSPADFLRAMGQKAEPEEKLVFKKKELEGVKNKVVVLKS